LTDTSLLTAALHLDELAVMRDGNLLGLLIEPYVLAKIRPELELAGFSPRLYHLREKNGRREIDLIAELSGGDVVAIEIKSSAAPTRGDARHLEWLRERFLAGAVLHGPTTVPACRAGLRAADLHAVGMTSFLRRPPAAYASMKHPAFA